MSYLPERRILHDRPLRGGGLCRLNQGHKGRCSSRTFLCDGCGRILRGSPAATTPGGGDPEDGTLEYCFLCVEVTHNVNA